MNKRIRSQTNVTSCKLYSCIQRYSCKYIYFIFFPSEVWLKIIPDLCSLGCYPENHCPWVPNVLVGSTCFAWKNARILILCDNKASLQHMSNTNYVQRVQDPFALQTGTGVQQVQEWVISCECYVLKQGRDVAPLFVDIFLLYARSQRDTGESSLFFSKVWSSTL